RALSLREQAGVALLAWAIAFEILAVATAIPGGPSAALTVDDASPIVGQTVHFDASGSVGHDNGRGRIVSYRFDFGDGAGTVDQVPPTANHAYTGVGGRRATVVVREERGNEGRASVVVYAPSFVAFGVGNHTLRIVVGNVTPAETYTQDNVKTFSMQVVAVTPPPPTTGGEFPWATALLVLGLAAAGVAAVLVAAWLLLTPREPRSLEPPPAEPPDES